MCISVDLAEFKKTVVLAASARRQGRDVRVLGYQNTAQNLATGAFQPNPGLDPRLQAKGIAQPSGGNAMLLYFPAGELMGPENVIDTSQCPKILKDVAETFRPRSRAPISMGMGNLGSGKAIVFQTGIYDVVMARDPRAIPDALDKVAPEKRPPLKADLFAAGAEWYPGWQAALCCFNNRQAIEADPMLWWFVEAPEMSHYHFVPTVDGHDGDKPDLTAKVALDHVIAVGMPGDHGVSIRYTNQLTDDVRALMPQRALGNVFNEKLPNGDFLFLKSEVDAGIFNPQRVAPGNFPIIRF